MYMGHVTRGALACTRVDWDCVDPCPTACLIMQHMQPRGSSVRARAEQSIGRGRPKRRVSNHAVISPPVPVSHWIVRYTS